LKNPNVIHTQKRKRGPLANHRLVSSIVLMLLALCPLVAPAQGDNVGVIKVRKPIPISFEHLHGVYELQGISGADSEELVALRQRGEIVKFEPSGRYARSVLEGRRGQTYHGAYTVDTVKCQITVGSLRKGITGARVNDLLYRVVRLNEKWLIMEDLINPSGKWWHFRRVEQVATFGDGY